MKRFFILASAAIVALASCAKTEVVSNSQPQEIVFKGITGVMTKGTLGEMTGVTLGVSAFYHAPNSNTAVEYFQNAEFDGTGSSDWKASPAQYYPLSGTLDFAGYAPHVETNAPTITHTNMVWAVPDNSTSQFDVLYSNLLKSNSKSETAVSMPLHHALSKITVSIGETTDVIISKVELLDTYQSGTLTVTYGDVTAAWSGQGTITTYDVTSKSIYVVPGPQTSLKLTYKFTNSTPTLEHTHALGNTITWEPGKHYKYSVTITPTEIKITPTVDVWTTEGDVKPSVDVQ